MRPAFAKGFLLRLQVSEKVFQNKGAVLRPFSARKVEAEGMRVGRELGLQSHPLSTQKALLQKEFLMLMKHQASGIPFRICRISDAFDFFLALSGEKTASIIFYRGPRSQFLTPTHLSIGGYPPIYAKVSDSIQGSRDLIISRDLSLLKQLDYLLSVRAKQGKLSKEDFRTQGLALGYPKSAVENFLSFSENAAQIPAYARLLLENNITLTPSLWNAGYIPTISGGRILESGHLEFWNSIVAREIGQFIFNIASAHNKISKMELLIAALQGKTSWAEDSRERVIREAIENAYGVPLSVGY